PPTLFRAFAQGQFFDSLPSHLPAIQKTARHKSPFARNSPPPNFSGCRTKKHSQRSSLCLRKVHSCLISLSSASPSKSDLSVRSTIPLLIIHSATSSNSQRNFQCLLLLILLHSFALLLFHFQNATFAFS